MAKLIHKNDEFPIFILLSAIISYSSLILNTFYLFFHFIYNIYMFIIFTMQLALFAKLFTSPVFLHRKKT